MKFLGRTKVIELECVSRIACTLKTLSHFGQRVSMEQIYKKCYVLET